MEWHDPPDDALPEWRAAEQQVFAGGEMPSCPTGDGGVLRFLFTRSEERPARGGFWIWCPVCRSYEHGSAAVPNWWRNVDIPHDRPMHDPAWLDEHWSDEWLSIQRPE